MIDIEGQYRVGDVTILDKLEGFVSDNLIAVEWQPIDHLAVGVGFNYFLLNATLGEDLLALTGDYEYSGLLLFGSFYL